MATRIGCMWAGLAVLGAFVGSQSHASAAAARAYVSGGTAVIQNRFCRLTLDVSTGEIRSLTPGTPTLRGPWFEVVEEDRAGMLPWETWKTGRETVFSSGPAAVAAQNGPVGALLTLTWKRPNGIAIEGQIRLAAQDRGPLLRLKVLNTTAAALVDTIRLPVLRGISVGDPKDDWFTFPHTLGARFRVQGLKAGEILEQAYPAFLTMQWLDLYDANQGVYVGCLDDYGYSKSLAIGREKDGRSVMAVRFSGCWIARKGDAWTTPWVQIAAHQGDWRAGADFYRPFAQKAFGPLYAPERLRQMPTAQCWLGHHANDGDIGSLFEIQQQAPIHASYLMKSVNTSTPEGWDGLRGSALDLHKAFDRIRELGGSPALFTFDRAPNMGRTNYAGDVGRWIDRRRDGSFQEGFRDLMPSPFDPAFRRARIGEAVRWVREFGLDEIHYDTEATAGASGSPDVEMFAGPDYNVGSGHRPNEVPHAFKELYRATVAACRKYNPEFTLRAEHLADFWFPEFAAGTAHFLSTATGTLVMAHHPPADAQLMPLLLRYTLPRHCAYLMPSMGMSDFWTFGTGMGHGFHGGGQSWCFNPGARMPESPPGELLHRYRFYDLDWRRFYDFRVGFEEAIVDADWSDSVAEAQIDGRWQRCDFPGPVVAVTSSGGGREVTLGQWYPQPGTSPFGKELVGTAAMTARPILVRVPTRLASPQVYLLDASGETPIRATVRDGRIQVRVPDPTCFAIEACTGPVVTLDVAPLAHPGRSTDMVLRVRPSIPSPGTLTLELPAGWPRVAALKVPEGREFRHAWRVRIPAGIFGRNYPIRAVLRMKGLQRTTAAHLKVMEPLTVLYGFETLDGPRAGQSHCVVPGRRCRLTVTCVNNTPAAAQVRMQVDGEQVRGAADVRLGSQASRDLGRQGSELDRWIDGKGPMPSCASVRSWDFECTGAASRPVRIDVSLDGRALFHAEAYPRTQVMDLAGQWQLRLYPVSRATVGGAERYDALDTEAVTPDVWDGGWRAVSAPVTLDGRAHQDNAWGIYRRLVYVPAEWQGSDVWLRLGRTGAPWGAGGTLNLVYVNGWPSGRIGDSGECRVSPFFVFGGWNLLAVASMQPNCLEDPYLFVRGVPAPGRIVASDAHRPPAGAFLCLGRRSTGQGITMPFIQGVAAEEGRRTDLAQGGENQFIYFAIADGFLREPAHPVEVEVEYLDTGTAPFGLDYDSTDATAPIDGAFKSAPAAARTDSGQWRKHVFLLSDARFANREHMGSDFRIYGTGEDVTIRRVEVRAAAGR